MTTCRVCGSARARVRFSEIETARITGRAHVDCDGHAEYRAVTPAEVDDVAPFEIVEASDVGERPRWWAWGEDAARVHATEITPVDLHTDPYDPDPDDGVTPTHALVLAGGA